MFVKEKPDRKKKKICTGCQNLWLQFNGLWKSLLTFYRATKTFCHKSLKIQETKTEKKEKTETKPGNITTYLFHAHIHLHIYNIYIYYQIWKNNN